GRRESARRHLLLARRPRSLARRGAPEGDRRRPPQGGDLRRRGRREARPRAAHRGGERTATRTLGADGAHGGVRPGAGGAGTARARRDHDRHLVARAVRRGARRGLDSRPGRLPEAPSMRRGWALAVTGIALCAVAGCGTDQGYLPIVATRPVDLDLHGLDFTHIPVTRDVEGSDTRATSFLLIPTHDPPRLERAVE